MRRLNYFRVFQSFFQIAVFNLNLLRVTIIDNFIIQFYSSLSKGNVMKLELDSNNHAVFSLNFHLILVTKYRKRVISTPILNRIQEISSYIGKNNNVEIKEINAEPDHVHFLLRTKPNCDLAKYINAMKSASSRLIKKEFPEVKKKLWKEYFWSASYCLVSVGGAPIEVLKKYIESQGGVDSK